MVELELSRMEGREKWKAEWKREGTGKKGTEREGDKRRERERGMTDQVIGSKRVCEHEKSPKKLIL